MHNLFFTIGLPRCGKSTFAKRWSTGHAYIISHCPYNHDESDPIQTCKRVVINADNIRKAISGDRWNSLTEPYVQAIKHTMIRALLEDYDVMVDGTHTTTNSIKQLLEIQPDANFVLIHGHDVGTYRLRAINTGQPDLVPIINNMEKNLITLSNNFEDMVEGIEVSIEAIHSELTTSKKV